MTEKVELKPCPFCASIAILDECGFPPDGTLYWGKCTQDDCLIDGPAHDDRQKAIAAWNERKGEK